MLRGPGIPKHRPEALEPPYSSGPLRAGNGQTVKRSSPAMMLPRPLLALVLLGLAASLASAQDAPQAKDAPQRHHAVSLIGAPKYPADFKHFDYVNPDAPKGGLVRMADIGSFDSLNPILYKGEAAAGLGLIYESLMQDSLEEPSTSYGLIAEWASYPPDFSSVTFKLRDEARWHDGKPITTEDVVYSLDVNKQANPRMGLYYKNVTKAEATGPNEVTFTFDVKGNRELPMIMGQLTILPKHYWTGKDKDGNQRDPLKTTLEPPLGSGPYRIKQVTPARTISYERVADYWGKDLPVNRGQWNFDELRFDYYRDDTVAFESFKAGGLDFHSRIERQELGHGLRFRRGARRLCQAPGGAGRARPTDAMLRAQSAAAAIPGPPRAAGLQPRLRLRVGQQEFVLRPVCPGRQLFRGHRARRSEGAAARTRARDPERGKGPGSTGGIHHGTCQSDQCEPG